jgi:hypothetical protein
MGVLGLLCAVPASYAQQHHGNIQFHGPPPSVTSPGWNGGLRNGFSSVTDPGVRNRGFNNVPQFRVAPQFGHRRFRDHHRRVFVPVYVPYYDSGYGYPYGYDASAYEQMSDQEVEQSPVAQPPAEPQVIIVREEPASSDSRYGEHSFEGRRDEAPAAVAQPAPPAQSTAEDLPVTTLAYRDGHKAEIRNYAIVGSNLIDLTKSPLMKRIPLASLDLDATRHENEENGVDFHLP